MFKNIVLIALIIGQSAFGQDVQVGSCGTDIVGISNTNISDYIGKWYQIERIDNMYEGACSSIDLRPTNDGGMTWNFTQVRNAEFEYKVGVARIYSNDSSRRLNATYQALFEELIVTVAAHRYVIALDSSSYALVMGCNYNDDNSRSVSAWKLSRTRSLTSEAVSAINEVVSTNPYLSSVTWKKTDQSTETCGSST